MAENEIVSDGNSSSVAGKLLAGQAQIIYADPPWKYNARNNPNTRFGGGVTWQYPTMETEEIAKLPIWKLAAPNSQLWLWTTWPKLRDGLIVMKRWGFRYCTIGFIWVKTNPKAGTIFHGVGHYTKHNSEPCLLGTRGSFLAPSVNTISSVILSPKRSHSQKPPEARQGMEAMYPSLTKVELFARQQSEGWTCQGNELTGQSLQSWLETI